MAARCLLYYCSFVLCFLFCFLRITLDDSLVKSRWSEPVLLLVSLSERVQPLSTISGNVIF